MHREITTTKPPTGKVTAALVTPISLNQPGVVYDPGKASDLHDMPNMAGCDPDALLCQEQVLKIRTDTPNLTPILTRTGYQYQTTRVKGVPISHKREINVHVHGHLRIKGRDAHRFPSSCLHASESRWVKDNAPLRSYHDA